MAVNETLIAKAISEGLGQGVPAAAAFTFIPMIIIFLLVGVLFFVVWIWMVIDCAKRDKFKSGDRVVWILLLVLAGIIGMILYYFMVMRED